MPVIGTPALLATHVPALAQAAVAADPSPSARIAVMVGAAVLGAAAGLMLALVLGTAFGVVPRPGRARSEPAATEHPEHPEPPQTLAAPGPPGSEPAAALRADPVAAPRERHRALYEAEYSWQESADLHALRRRIGAQLASATPSADQPAPGPGTRRGPQNPAEGR